MVHVMRMGWVRRPKRPDGTPCKIRFAWCLLGFVWLTADDLWAFSLVRQWKGKASKQAAAEVGKRSGIKCKGNFVNVCYPAQDT